MSISISAFLPDAQLKDAEFNQSLTLVAMRLAKMNKPSAIQYGIGIEIQFMLTGKYDDPGYSGMRITRFDTKDNIIRIETAIPEHMNNSHRATQYIYATLLDAVENVDDFMRENEIAFDVTAYNQFINEAKAQFELELG